jgi:hypothetical protein
VKLRGDGNDAAQSNVPCEFSGYNGMRGIIAILSRVLYIPQLGLDALLD